MIMPVKFRYQISWTHGNFYLKTHKDNNTIGFQRHTYICIFSPNQYNILNDKPDRTAPTVLVDQ